jgi:MoaA/NifB/PqqE/SkfB family radical SAM enzyme
MSNLTGEVIKRMVSPQISKANIAVTWRCNQRCKSCNIWQTYQGNAEKIQDEFDVSEYNSFLKTSGLMWVSLTGGEPTLRDDIGAILTQSSMYVQMVNITTNGSNPRELESGIRDALQKGPAFVSCNISCEGDEQTHNTFVGKKDSWGSMIESVQRLKLLRNTRFSVKLETIISAESNGEAVAKLAKKLNVPLTYTIEQEANFYRNKKAITSGSPAMAPIKLPNVSLSPMPTSDELANYFLLREYKRKKKMACVAGQYSVFIDPYLTVYPCLFKYPKAVLGYLRECHYDLQGMATEVFKSCHCATPCETQVGLMFRPWRVI